MFPWWFIDKTGIFLFYLHFCLFTVFEPVALSFRHLSVCKIGIHVFRNGLKCFLGDLKTIQLYLFFLHLFIYCRFESVGYLFLAYIYMSVKSVFMYLAMVFSVFLVIYRQNKDMSLLFSICLFIVYLNQLLILGHLFITKPQYPRI